jgi:hypothetical protein
MCLVIVIRDQDIQQSARRETPAENRGHGASVVNPVGGIAPPIGDVRFW